MAVIDSAELLLQAKNYSGSGDWLDEANAHDAVNWSGRDGSRDSYCFGEPWIDYRMTERAA